MNNTKTDLNAILRSEFPMYLRKVFKHLNPGDPFLDNWHIDAMCHALMMCAQGERHRQIINVPPRHLKSICGVAYVTFLLGHHPEQRVIVVSYAQQLASELSNLTRSVMASDWYCALFPKTRISKSKNTEAFFKTTAGGGRLGTTIGGTITGFGADHIVIDDPMKGAEIPSEAQLREVTDYYRGTLFSRLNNKQTGVVLVIMQRLHIQDLTGYLLEQDDWDHLCLPARAEQGERVPISKDAFYIRKAGEILHPARESDETLQKIEGQLGPIAYSGQYQQRPSPLGGAIVKSHMLQRCDAIPKSMPEDYFYQSWDTAGTIGEYSSYSVCLTFLVRGEDFYLVDILRKRMEYLELRNAVRAMAIKWHAEIVLIEKQNGSMSLLQELVDQRELNVQFYSPTQDKQTRLLGELGPVARGHFHILTDQPWYDTFVSELLQFPNAKHDDQVDALSQFLWARRVRPGVRRFKPHASLRHRPGEHSGKLDEPTGDSDSDPESSIVHLSHAETLTILGF